MICGTQLGSMAVEFLQDVKRTTFLQGLHRGLEPRIEEIFQAALLSDHGMATSVSEFARRYGQWAVVTGASSGIGEQFARLLAKRGLDVVLIARRSERLLSLSSELQSQHNVATRVVVADLTTTNGLRAVEDSVSDLDVGLLVNNAGIESVGAYMELDTSEVEKVIELNVTAVARLTSTVGKQLVQRGRGGGLIFVSSINARPWPYLALYAASKSFVSTLAVSIRYELAKDGVDVLCFEPGAVESEMMSRQNERFGEENMTAAITAMKAEKAVEMCLDKLGKRTVFTPGFRNILLKKGVDFLPFIMLPIVAKMISKLLENQKQL